MTTVNRIFIDKATKTFMAGRARKVIDLSVAHGLPLGKTEYLDISLTDNGPYQESVPVRLDSAGLRSRLDAQIDALRSQGIRTDYSKLLRVLLAKYMRHVQGR